MEKALPNRKAALELDKFKRRLIRAVARLLLQEKKPEDQIWSELKKEAGCDCELLWTRMRALTVKKLDRLLAANDCMDGVPKAARMSLTDWLLFDLVLVHQKIDLIGQNKSLKGNEDPEVLIELVDLVKMFSIEHLCGDKLAEAWSSATLYYNKQGHHCSPMLLQRRWYQLKMIVRDKFYDFWYAYRGNSSRVKFAQPYRPTPLQIDIARNFKTVILQPFHEWEELINQRLVIMPDEFEKLMKERSAVRKPKPPPAEDTPDLVVIEPRIDTIDLRFEPDDDGKDENRKKDENPPLPLVKVKEEPQEDDMNVETQIQLPKKSVYEEVLESTHLENEQLDNMYTEIYEGDLDNDENEIEEHGEAVESIAGDEEESLESVLPQITSVFGNVSDTSVLANINESTVYRNAKMTEVADNSNDTNVVCNVEDTGACGNVDDTDVCDIVEDTNVCGNDKNTGLSRTVGETIVLDNVEDIIDSNNIGESAPANEKASGAYDNTDENSARDSNKETSARSKDKDTGFCSNVADVSANVKETSPVIADINEISHSDEISGNVVETNVIGNVMETCVSGNVLKTSDLIATEKVPDMGVINTQTSNIIVTDKKEVDKDKENISHPIVITDSDDDNHDIEEDISYNRSVLENTIVTDMVVPKNTIDQPMEVDSTPQVLETSFTEPSKVSDVNKDAVESENNVVKKDEVETKPDIKSFTFREQSNDICFSDEGIEFADDGIEFADDGIVFIDEDSHNHNEIETKIALEEETDDGPKIDAKLLMCPIIYTTRLDDMTLFHKQPFDNINGKHLLDTIALKSKPILNETYNDSKETIDNLKVNYCDKTIESVNDSSKTINYVQEIVNSKPIENILTADRNSLPVNDSSIRIKKEPVNKIIEYVPTDNIEPIEQHITENERNIPSDDGNITSDDGDCDENVIDESHKVKPTSYLLQKPRSRRYHPIQLCKNPDFNTKLKRLNVGFFSSPRNRVLIKTCKPLTIDLSKAFESKLISGTLYLKPSDHNVVQKIIDDTKSQNVSVIPSAMPAQSLINNSKVADILPMLRNVCLQTSKPPEDLGPTVERNKVINLPDITEIRRINQQLLTAEVTPIQVQNNQPQVPVTIVSSINNPSSKTLTISEIRKNLQPAEATDRRGPPKLLDITEDLPAKASTERYSLTVRSSLHAIRPSKPMIGRPPTIINGKRFFPPKAVVWKPREIRPEIPWLSRNNDATIQARQLDETLLTLDSLNKMLFLLTDKLEPEALLAKKPKSKGRKKTSAQQTKQQPEGLKPNDEPIDESIDSSNCTLDCSKQEETSEEQITKCQKPKINIKSATNYPPDKDAQNKTEDAGTDQSKKKIQYCCWARQMMLKLLFSRQYIPRHECPKLCGCCCRNLLRDYFMHDQKLKKSELLIINETVNDTLGLDKAAAVSSKTVEAVGEKPVETLAETPDTRTPQITGEESILVPDEESILVSGEESILVPDDSEVMNVEAPNTEPIMPITGNEPIVIDAIDTDDNIPVLGGEVFVKTTAIVAPLAARGLENPGTPAVPVIPGGAIVSCNGVTPEKGTQPYQYTHCVTADNLTGGLILNSVIKTPAATITQTKSSPPSLRKFLESKKANVPNRLKTKMRPPQKILPNLPPKVKEKMIFLNSKQISDKPSLQPVFLGRNKILLTTVRFPPDLKLFKQAKDALKSSLKIPKGVHLVYLPDGTLSYNIDNNVVVKATELAEMPAIIAAVRARMSFEKAPEEQLIKQNVPPTPVVTETEVVDLVDDDDESRPSINEHNTPPLVTEVQTTEDCVTINEVDSSNDNCNSQMKTFNEIEENRPASNVNGNLMATAIENIQDKSATADENPNTIIDIPKNIQESNQNDVPSASTEQVQDHPDPPIQNITAEVDEISVKKPSNQIKSTDTQEVLAEKVQGSDPSSQNVSTEVQNHPEESSSGDLIKNKTKNILSDLMEMSGIFDDEDMTPAVEESVPTQPAETIALPQPMLVTPLVEQPPTSVSNSTQPPNLTPISLQPVLVTTVPPPKLKSPVGELTPITSLYELKYACANKGTFFKLDFDTGLIVPINVCMKPSAKRQTKPLAPTSTSIAPKSVIDLTDDDDKSEPVNSPVKRSLLLVNNTPTGSTAKATFSGPVKPVKLFKALKPSILKRLNLHKMHLDSKHPLYNKSADHKIKRKQFLRKINLNADTDMPDAEVNIPKRKYTKNMKVNSDMINLYKDTEKVCKEPTSCTDVVTTILSDDDSSDDEPLAKIAKRKRENLNALEKNANAPKVIENAPGENANALEGNTNAVIELELPVADNGLIEPEAPIEKQIESELPAADAANDAMSDDDNDVIDQEAPFGFDVTESNEEEEDCILGF